MKHGTISRVIATIINEFGIAISYKTLKEETIRQLKVIEQEQGHEFSLTAWYTVMSYLRRSHYIREEYITGQKFYTIDYDNCPVTLLYEVDSDYSNGDTVPFEGYREAILSTFDYVEYPGTSKQVFDILLEAYPAAAGHKGVFDTYLDELVRTKSGVSKTKNLMNDHNGSSASKFVYWNTEDMNKYFNKT